MMVEVSGDALIRYHTLYTGIAAPRGRPIPAGSHKLATHTGPLWVPAVFSCHTPRLLVVDSDHSHARSTTHMHSPVSCQCICPPLPPAKSIQTTVTHVPQPTYMHSGAMPVHPPATAAKSPLRRICLSTQTLKGRDERTAYLASGAVHLVRDRRADEQQWP
jgi:hypothetical protein